jgi:hypothetical protein
VPWSVTGKTAKQAAVAVKVMDELLEKGKQQEAKQIKEVLNRSAAKGYQAAKKHTP